MPNAAWIYDTALRTPLSSLFGLGLFFIAVSQAACLTTMVHKVKPPTGQRNRHSLPVPENVRIFRTLTAMLSYVPRARPIPPLDNIRQKSFDRKDEVSLKVTDAFVQLANLNECDVLAASANSGFDEISLMNCVSSQPPATDEETPKTWSSSFRAFARKFLGRIVSYGFVLVRNDRFGDDSSFSSDSNPTIEQCTPPKDLKEGQTAYEYIAGLQTNW